MECASAIFLTFLLAHTNAQLRYFSNVEDFERSLQPVRGLYVKPSSDGETGDLFIAASEDSGVQTPWVADTSVKLIPQREPNGRSERPIDESNVATLPAPNPGEEEPRFVQVPQLFYNQLIAAAAAGTAERIAAEKPDVSGAQATFPPSFMQAWGSYAYPQPQFVLVAPEEWLHAQARFQTVDSSALAALPESAAPAAAATSGDAVAAATPSAPNTDESTGQSASQMRLIKL